MTDDEKLFILLRTMRRLFGNQEWDNIKILMSNLSKDKMKTSLLNELQKEADKIAELKNEIETW